MVRPEHFVQSRPCEVIFAGFRSTTTQLQQAGWVLAANEDFHRESVSLMAHHREAQLYLVAEDVSWPYTRYLRDRDIEPRFIVRRIARSLESVTIPTDFSLYRQIDAMPQIVSAQRQRIEDFALFAAPLVRTEEIIVEPQSVAECLDLIKRLQAPDLARIRKRNMEAGEPMQQARFHAQILSLAA